MRRSSAPRGVLAKVVVGCPAQCMRQELGRCGLFEMQEEWASIARKGYCTMNPVLGRWLLEGSGAEVGPPNAKHSLGLSDVLPLLAPDHKGLLQHAHDAGCDAQMTRWVYVALVDRARAFLGPGAHEGAFEPEASFSPGAVVSQLAAEAAGSAPPKPPGDQEAPEINPMS